MEDWGSPWADDEKLSNKDDKPKRKLPLKVKDEEDEEEGEEGSNLEREEEVVATPVTKEKQDVATAGLTVDWDSGFVDSSAWANATPRVQIGDGDSFGWRALRSEGFAGVGAKGGSDSGEGEGRIEDDWRGDDKDNGVKTTNLHPIATDEVNAWGAGSDWGDPRTPRTPRTPESRIGRTSDALSLSLDEIGGNISNGRFDGEVKDSPTPDVERHDQLIDAENLLNSPTKQRLSDRETQNVEESLGSHLQAVLESVSGPAPAKTQEDPKGASTSESHSATPAIYEANSSKDDYTNVSTANQGDGDDEFGDFAVEGGEFEEPQAPIPEPVLPLVIKAPPPDSFEIDVSLVSKLYPIPTSCPDLPPIEEIISTTESRKTWYRLSAGGTMRRNRSDDDDYVRVMWAGSEVQARVSKIVEKWISEDRNSGGGGLMSGGKGMSAIFGWGDSNSKISDQKPISLVKTPPQLSSGGRSRKASGSRPASISAQSLLSKPTSVGIPSSSESVGGGSVSSPQAASFGWNSTQPQSGPSSAEGGEKTPATPLRTNSHSPTRHSLSSQLTPRERPTALHSPTTDNASARRSMAAASTTLSPTHSPTADAKNTPIAPAPEFPPAVDNPITADPLPAGLPANTQATDLAFASGLDDWGALESMSANASPASANSQSRNYDRWGAFEDLTMPGSSTPASKEVAPITRSRGPPAATNLESAVPASRPSVQSSSESNKKLNSAQTALGPADTTNDGRDDLEPLSPQPPKSQTPSNASSSHVPKNQKINSPALPRSKDQKTSQPSPVECSREGSRLSIPSTPNMPGSGSFISAPIAKSAFDGVKKNTAVSNVQTQQDSDEGDDWGEMVQSPLMPTEALGFPEVLGMPAPASSQDITSLSASTPPAPSIPQRMLAPDLAPVLPSAPAPAIQPASVPSAALNLGDLGQKSWSSTGDSWDLSIFEGPPTPKSGFCVPKGISEPAGQGLWDTPAVAQSRAPESPNSKAIREIVEGLPDLRHMLS